MRHHGRMMGGLQEKQAAGQVQLPSDDDYDDDDGEVMEEMRVPDMFVHPPTQPPLPHAADPNIHSAVQSSVHVATGQFWFWETTQEEEEDCQGDQRGSGKDHKKQPPALPGPAPADRVATLCSRPCDSQDWVGDLAHILPAQYRWVPLD